MAEGRRDSQFDPVYVPTQEALNELVPIPAEGIEFVNQNGERIEHERTLVALPSGDEVYTDKRAAIWSQPMKPSYMPLGKLGLVHSLTIKKG